jgi:hypothetical protein
MEEAHERPLPASGGAGAAPPSKNTAPASWRLTSHIALGTTWGGLVGGRGHRKGQLRMPGSPSVLHGTSTKKARIGGPPGGRGPAEANPITCSGAASARVLLVRAHLLGAYFF